HRLAHDRATRRSYFHLVSVPDPFLQRQPFRYLDEELRLQMIEYVLVLAPVVEMFGQTIGRANNRELLLLAVNVLIGLEDLRDRIRADIRMQWIIYRCLPRFVMFGERAIVHLYNVEFAHSFGVHNERPEAFFRFRVRPDVRYIADPPLPVPRQS